MVLPRVKICCIGSVAEARLAIEHGGKLDPLKLGAFFAAMRAG